MITVNIDKAKIIGHDIRRAARATKFKPLDEFVIKQIPGTDVQAIEAERQAIRDQYAEIQIQINAATTIEQIKSALNV